MSYRYITIKPDGELISTVEKKLPDWKKIQEYVEGSFQLVPYFSKMEFDGRKLNRGTAYANEEGRIKGMPFNPIASACWLEACPTGDPTRMLLFGPILFIAKEKEPVNDKAS